MVEIREYLDPMGRAPFAEWFASLKVRLELGNFSNARGVGAGLYECRIDFGPGYRVYFGKDGATLVILLGGGTKKRQNKDIQTALNHWKAYKHREER